MFADLSARLAEVRDRIHSALSRSGHSQRVTVISVTKTFGPEAVRAVAQAGLTDVGENKVQEALAKQEQTRDIAVNWHLIGHLQRNKVKSLAHFHTFHALDSSRLADAIDGWAAPQQMRIRALVQVNVAGEETKGGFSLAELPAEAERLRARTGLEIRGAMTMAPYDAPEPVLRRCFAGARSARDMLAAAGHPATELSMGMSHDFEIAVEEGATLVRLGTILFGDRS
ncbi:MAG TPA: YggS family pyridoxal phosphate-dependent enzyme [Gemmatimonadaceae bacterium]|nr:YggS family pyridoxal phosphate-dependent enzyme [Gemmatimonadaceae bacterium]